MLKTYCQHCGGANEYASEKPKFCAKCGKSFSIVKVAAKPPAFEYSFVNDNSEPETETDTIDNPFKMEADIIVEKPNKALKLGEVGLQRKTGFERSTPARSINIDVKNKNIKEFFNTNLPELPEDDG